MRCSARPENGQGEDDTTLLFEYSPEALAQGLELSPLHLKLRAAAYGAFPSHLYRLPGLVADSLPDGWGLLLMDRLFRQQRLRHPGPLDRLSFIGDRAMGALRFAPATELDTQEPDWTLLALAGKASALWPVCCTWISACQAARITPPSCARPAC